MLLAYLLAGCVTGFCSGLFGIGGGVVLVPFLYFIFHHSMASTDTAMHLAAGTSLGVITITSAVSAWMHQKRVRIPWGVYQRLLPGILLGVIIGVMTADMMQSKWLQIFFGIFMLFVAGRLLVSREVVSTAHEPNNNTIMAFSPLIGFKSGLLGIGGGTITIPVLLYSRIAMRQAVAVSALCSLTMASIGAVTAMITGANENIPVQYHAGYVYFPAVIVVCIASIITVPFGVWLSHRIDVAPLQRIFAIGLLVLGISMILH